jgi:hypothetical protein
MIRELQLASFMKEKISFLAMLARDMASLLGTYLIDEDPNEETEIEDRDVAELVASLESMERDPGLWGDPESINWLPRHSYAGMLQSSLDEYYRQNDSVIRTDNLYGEKLRDDPLRSTNLTPIVKSGTRKVGRFRLSRKDPRWVLVLKAKAIKRRRGAAKFPDNSGNSTLLDGQARLVLIGDWGSGIPQAIKVAREIWNVHLLPDLGRNELHVAHLGDVYYAGLAGEYTRNFLRDWPVPRGQEKYVNSWCLPGNHDMFSGGHGFFDMLKDARFTCQNKSSYFLLENAHWQVFGLDTSFDPRDFTGDTGELYGEQAAWVAQKRAMAPKKKCLILTHHQPFSVYDHVEENLERRLRPIRSLGHIDAWFWGHEHRCAVYDKHEGVRFPVLLGHGGFPEKPRKKRLGAPRLNYEWTSVDKAGFLIFGFAVLDFDAGQINVRLVDEDGKLEHQFTIV